MTAAPEGGTTVVLQPQGPLSLALMQRRMAFAKATEYCAAEDGSVFIVVGDSDAWDVVRVREVGRAPHASQLEVTFSHTDEHRIEGSLRRLRHMLSLDADVEPFYAAMADDPAMARVTARFRGLRPVLHGDLFASIIKTIIGQQLNMAFAGTLTLRLIQRCGTTAAVGDMVLPVFPSPAAIARLHYEDLQRLQYSRRKAEYVIDFARLVDSGAFDLDALWNADDEDVTARLTKVRGLGRWSAECTLLFGLGRPDVLPAADIGLRNAVRRVWGLGHQPTEEEVRQLGERWRPFRSLATFYLWETLSEDAGNAPKGPQEGAPKEPVPKT